MAEFVGKRIVITGGAGGIGVETARTMLASALSMVMSRTNERSIFSVSTGSLAR